MRPGKSASASILLVDDDEVSRRMVRAVLNGAGYEVSEAGSVHAALTMATANTPHLIVLDLVLPDQDGFAFLAERRINPKLAAVPVIVLSGLDERQAAHQAIAEGANDFLSKPLHAATLLGKARKYLRDRRFLSAEFDGPEAPLVTVTLPATVLLSNASRCAVVASARVSPDLDGAGGVRLRDWDLLSLAGASCEFVRRSRQPPRSVGPGRYLMSFNLVGLTREQESKLRKLIGAKE